MRRLVALSLVLLPVAALAREQQKSVARLSPLDLALTTCERTFFHDASQLGDDYTVYRRLLGDAEKAQPGLRQSAQVWKSSEDSPRAFTIAQWIGKCDGWYAKAARAELSRALASCDHAHRTGLAAPQASQSYRTAVQNVTAVDASLLRSDHPFQGETVAVWVQRCDRWFSSHAPQDLARR